MAYQRLPARKTFNLAKANTGDSPEVKQLWLNRLMYLLETPLKAKGLSELPFIKEALETYDLKGATLADIMHLAQIAKAIQGDTKAYVAVTRALGSIDNYNAQHKDTEDPVVLLTKMLYGAMEQAGVQMPKGNGPIIEADFDE